VGYLKRVPCQVRDKAEKITCVCRGSLRVGASLRVRAVAAQPEGKSRPAGGDDDLTVEVDASSDPAVTIVSVKASNRPGGADIALAPSRHIMPVS